MENYMFDFDGTLADSGETAVLATQATFKDFGLSLPSSDQIRGYMGIPIEKSFPLMGAKEALAKLKEKDKKIYAVSSKHSEALRRNLELLKIASYFDDLVGSDQIK